jgi:hypothetical protein
MQASVSACQQLVRRSGAACLLLVVNLMLSVPAIRAQSDPLPPASTLDSCGRTPSTPTPLRNGQEGLTWEPVLDGLPAVASPSPDERAYLAAMDEVHGHVRTSGSRIGMAMIMWSICDIDGEALGNRLLTIRADLDQAVSVLAGLPVPERFGAVHRDYQQVVRLYQQGLDHMERTAQDGDPQHLRDAFPLTKAASDELAELESLVWAPSLPEEVGQPSSPSDSVAPSGG